MVMRKPIKHLYEFGPFRLDASERILMCEGKAIPLAPKVLDTLLVLVENNGAVLEKEELLKTLWPDTIVEESNLTTYISQLRKALGENGSEQNYIETIPRRGYRFVAAVNEVNSDYADILIHERTKTHVIVEEEIEADEPAIPIPAQAEIIVPPKNISPTQAQSKRENFRLNKWLGIGLGGSVLVLLAIFAFAPKWIFKAAPPFENIAISKVTTSGRNPLAAISPDGKYITYVVRDAPNQSLWLRQTATTSNVQIVPPADTQFLPPTFSPDGMQIYYAIYEKFFREKTQKIGVLYQIPTLGGTPRKIIEDVDSQIAISPDGKQIAFVRNDLDKLEHHLMIANIDGSAQRILFSRKVEEGFPLPSGPAWSPDGKLLACAVNSNTPGDKHVSIATIEISSGKDKIIGAKNWHWVGQLAWLSNGTGLLANAWHLGSKSISDQLWHVQYPSGEAKQVTKDVNNYQGLSLASTMNAFVTVQATRLSRIWVLNDLNETNAIPITSGLGDSYGEFLGLAFTPEGKILYGSQASGNADVWVMDGDGKNQKQLTTDSFSDLGPIITSDNQTILYSSYRDGLPHIWKMKADGTDPQQLTNGSGETEATLSPDGKWIVYLQESKEQKSLWKIAVAGGTPQLISSLSILRAAISPDGQMIACVLWNEATKARQLGLLAMADGKLLRTIDFKVSPRNGLLRWRPDGKSITYIATENEVSNIWQQPIDGSAPQQLTKFISDLIFRFAWSQDGRKLAIERGVNVNDIILVKEQK